MGSRVAILLLCWITALGLRAETTPAQRRALDKMYAGIEQAGERLGAREIMRYLLEGASAGEDPARLGRAIETLRTQQELRPGHVDFGNFRWYRGQPEVRDRNAVQFVCQNAVTLALGYPDALTGGNAEAFRTLLRDAARGCLGQKVNPGYTNIFLMKAVNLVLLGRYLDDVNLADSGRAQLDEWFEWTRTNGITEYNSTTYTGIDLDSASLLIRYAADPADRARGETLARLFWTELAANWFAPARRLGGSHSRDYDFLLGLGYTDVPLAENGWIAARRAETLPAEAASRRFIAPPEWTAAILAQTTREVVQRWSAGPGETATHYLTPDYSIGTCGTSKAYDDKVFAVQFSGERTTPMAYFVMESRQDPYGTAKEPDRNGHNKALHLRPSLVTAQNRDRVLLLAAEDTEVPRHLRPVPVLKGLWSHLVFPAAAKVTDAAGVELAPGPVDTNRPVFIRLERTTLALSFLAARKEWATGSLPVTLIRDGEAVKAARFTIEHGTGEHPGRGLVAFSAETALTPDDAAFRAFASRVESEPTDVSIYKDATARITRGAGADRLSASLDLLKRRVLSVEGQSPLEAGELLRVNGVELWKPLLPPPALARNGQGELH